MGFRHMARFVNVLLVQILAKTASQYPCDAKSGGTYGIKEKAKCAGHLSTSCSIAECCEIKNSCEKYQAAWSVASLIPGSGCKKSVVGDTNEKFWDWGKAKMIFTGETLEDIKANCCTEFESATCGDWVDKICPVGQYVANPAKAAPADEGKTTISNWQSTCCSDKATCKDFTCDEERYTQGSSTTKCLGGSDTCTTSTCCTLKVTCAQKAALPFLNPWATDASRNCMKPNKDAPTEKASMFFDLKKVSKVIPGDSAATDEQIRTACCTPFSEATCSDWVLKSCASDDRYISQTDKTAAADAGPEGNSYKDDMGPGMFDRECCSDKATCKDMTCPKGTTAIDGRRDTKCSGDASSCQYSNCCTGIPDAMKCADWVPPADDDSAIRVFPAMAILVAVLGM